MATTTVVIPISGNYRSRPINSTNWSVNSTQASASSRTFAETRPDRVRSRKPAGWLYPKGYSLTVNSSTGVSGLIRRISYGNEQIWEDGIQGSSAWLDASLLPESSNQRRQAEIQALLKLKDQKFNAGVALAEAQKTANMLGDNAARLGKAYRAFRRGNWREVKRQLYINWREIPSSWLQLQYGWKPLLMEIHGAVEHLQGLPASDWVVTVKGVVKEEVTSVVDVTDTNHPRTTTSRQFRGQFVRLDYHPKNESLSLVSQLGLTNPLLIAWELVPYSFVVDWMVPIGDWLEAMDAQLGYDFLSGSRTSRRETVVDVIGHTRYTGNANTVYTRNTAKGRSRAFQLTRTVYGSKPTVWAPTWQPKLSLGRMANGLALLSQAFGR